MHKDPLRVAVLGSDPEQADLVVPPEVEGVAPQHALIKEVRPDRFRIYRITEHPIVIERAGHHLLVPLGGFDLWVADKIIVGQALVPWHRPPRRDR